MCEALSFGRILEEVKQERNQLDTALSQMETLRVQALQDNIHLKVKINNLKDILEEKGSPSIKIREIKKELGLPVPPSKRNTSDN